MTTSLHAPAAREVATTPAIIDCDIHNELDSERDLLPYLSARWRAHLLTYGTRRPSGAE
jgi:hypothetical protein